MSDNKYHSYYDNNPLRVVPPFSAGLRCLLQSDFLLSLFISDDAVSVIAPKKSPTYGAPKRSHIYIRDSMVPYKAIKQV